MVISKTGWHTNLQYKAMLQNRALKHSYPGSSGGTYFNSRGKPIGSNVPFLPPKDIIKRCLLNNGLRVDRYLLDSLLEIGRSGKKAEVSLYYSSIVPKLAGYLSKCKDPQTSMAQLKKSLALFEAAHDYIPTGSVISKHAHSLTKFDLLSSIYKQIAFDALTNEKFYGILEELSKRAKFLCILTMMALADDVYYSKHLLGLKTHLTEKGISKELSLCMEEARQNFSARKLRKGPFPDIVSEHAILFKLLFNTIKSFNYLWMTRLYLQLMQDLHFSRLMGSFKEMNELSPYSAKRAIIKLKKIFHEMSALSEVVLRVIHETCLERLRHEYGQLDGRFSVLTYGASSRKEFPSFDYDCLIVYDAGKTDRSSGGYKGQLEAKDYYQRLANYIRYSLTVLDKKFDQDLLIESLPHLIPQGHGDPKENAILAPLSFYQRVFEARGQNAYLEICDLLSMKYASGDKSLAEEFHALVEQLAKKIDPLVFKSEILLQREARLKNEGVYLENIKNCRGGLRDFHELLWFNFMETDFMPQTIIELFSKNEDRQQMIQGFLFLMSVRIFMDFYYGRNEKDLPKDLGDFLMSFGVTSSDFKKALEENRNNISRITEAYFEHLLGKDPALKESKDRLLQKYMDEINVKAQMEGALWGN
jgi:hypothetical protein